MNYGSNYLVVKNKNQLQPLFKDIPFTLKSNQKFSKSSLQLWIRTKIVNLLFFKYYYFNF